MRAFPAFGLVFAILLAVVPAAGADSPFAAQINDLCVDARWEPTLSPPPYPVTTRDCTKQDREVPDPADEHGAYEEAPFDLIFPGPLGCNNVNDCTWEYFWTPVWEPYGRCAVQNAGYPIALVLDLPREGICNPLP